LIVSPRRVLGEVGELYELPASQPVEGATAAVHDHCEGAVAATDERHERRKGELVADTDRVGYGLGERHRGPDVVEAGCERGEPVRAVAIELGREEPRQPVQIRAHAESALVPEIGPEQYVLAPVEERVDPRLHVACRRREAGVEVDVETDRGPSLCPKG